ncbi:MAG: RnfABCDGE type electron transport complex subunit C [Thermodesulfobacteriota bacterium]
MASSDELIKPKKFRRGLDLGPPHPVTARPIETMPAPSRVIVSLKQHRGKWCEPKVRTGDVVKMGQVLGDSADPEAAPVHAPVSGKVLAVADRVDPFGRKVPMVTIENDGAEEWVKAPEEDSKFMKKKLSAMIRAVRESGVVQATTGRPVHIMLAPPERPKAYIFLVGIPVIKPAELLLVNALDTEPTLAGNRRQLLERPTEAAAGIALLKKILGVKKAVLVMPDDLGDASGVIQTAAGQEAQPLFIKNRYPVASPELLTLTVTGQEVPWPGGEPRDVGVAMLDLESILMILEAVRDGRPQIDRVVSVRGPEITPRNLRVRLGTPLGDVAAFTGATYEKATKVVVGGVMDGVAQYTGEAPVTKEVRGLNVFGNEDPVVFNEHLCFKCGRCVAVCPMRLLPNVITNFCEFGYFSDAEDAELFKCLECGCCAYVCPAKRPLVHYLKHGKAEVTAMRAAR